MPFWKYSATKKTRCGLNKNNWLPRQRRLSSRNPISRQLSLPSVLWRCWLGGRKGIRPVKIEWWGVGVVICLERGADLHMAQLMPLPPLSLASVKSRLVLPFWYRLTRVVPDKGPLNVCVCVCLSVCVSLRGWHWPTLSSSVTANETASPGNRHCANCIGTLSFPIVGRARRADVSLARLSRRHQLWNCGYTRVRSPAPADLPHHRDTSICSWISAHTHNTPLHTRPH